MKITDDRARDLLHWHDDMAGEHTLLFDEMARYRDAAALIRQLQAAEQAAWHAGMDAGRELGRGKERAGAKAAEIEALKVEVAAQRARADAMAGEAIKHEARAERLERGLRYAVRVWVLSDEIEWSEEEIDKAVERIIDSAKKEAGND